MLFGDVDFIIIDRSTDTELRRAVANNLRSEASFPFMLVSDPEDSEGGGYRCGARFSTLDVMYGIDSGSFVEGTKFVMNSNSIRKTVVVKGDRLFIEKGRIESEDPNRYREFEEAVERVNRYCEGCKIRKTVRGQRRSYHTNRRTGFGFA